MPHEVPIGFDENGKLHTAMRFTEAELGDIYMANEMYAASPEGQANLKAALDSLRSASVTATFTGTWES